MKRISLLLIVLSISSCSVFRNVAKKKQVETITLVESKKVTEKAPGDQVTIYLPMPLESPDRPKSTVKTYKGESGAVTDVSFDSTGTIKRIHTDCPEVDRLTEENREMDYKLRLNEAERKADIEVVNAIGKWFAITFIPIGGFFALVFLLQNQAE